MKPKFIISLLLVSTLILTTQTLLGVNIAFRNDGIVTAESSTNNPSLVTTNLSNPPVIINVTTNPGSMYYPATITTNYTPQIPMVRCSLSIQNTNSTSVNIYSDINGSNLVRVINANDIFIVTLPIGDTTQFYLRSSTTNSVPAVRSETWGR